MKAWVTMGFFDDRGDGLIMELDAATGQAREVLRLDPPPELRVPSKGFTGAAWLDDDLLVCGSAAVFRLNGEDLTPRGTLALPSFNDLHGVAVAGDRIHVVNTGLDCVDTFDLDGAFLGSTSFEAGWLIASRVAGETPTRADWRRLHARGWRGSGHDFAPDSPDGAYYRGDARQPFHQRQQRDFVHPNHVCSLDGRLLVTSLVRQAVIDASTWRQVIRVDSPPHDGLVHGDGFFITRVDGHVERRDLGDLAGAGEVIDITRASGVSGWCRGLHIDEELMWVGFTEIRQRPGHDWDRGAFGDTSTAVVAIEHASGDVVRVFDLTDRERHSKVFALLKAR